MNDRLRIAVFDRYWNTVGGGEQFAGGIAAVFAEDHHVELLGPEPIAFDRLRDRLGLDLDRCGERRVADDAAVARASADYDVFVNCTYLSPAVNLSPAGIYVTHFPGEPPEGAERVRQAALRALPRRRGHLVNLDGLYPAEAGGRAVWTNGLAAVAAWAPGGGPCSFVVSAEHVPDGPAAPVRVRVGTRVVAEAALARGDRLTVRWEMADRPVDRPEVIVVESATFRPSEVFGTADPRLLGVQLTDAVLAGRAVGFGPMRPPAPVARGAFLDTYQVLVANSGFTAGWTERLWGRPATVVYPPVIPRLGGAKGRTILSVGRFFASDSGHSKKQLEMIRAFAELVASGRAAGWELHLAGGCSPRDRDYGVACRAAAEGLPVHLHFNAPGAHLDRLLAEASIYWHAAGLGEDPDRHPHRFEHFGISVVEAMTAGCVPVVFAAAGPAEIVRDGVDGVHVHDRAGFVAATAALVGDDDRRRRLAAAARTRAEDFGAAAFRARLGGALSAALAAGPSRH